MTTLTKIKREVALKLANRRAEPITVTLEAGANGAFPSITFQPKGARRTYTLPLSTVYTLAVERDAMVKVRETKRRRTVSRGLLSISRGA